MKLRHLFLAGLLTTLAALMLLSIALPQKAAAAPRVKQWAIGVDLGGSSYICGSVYATRKEAQAYCDTSYQGTCGAPYPVVGVYPLGGGTKHNLCN